MVLSGKQLVKSDTAPPRQIYLGHYPLNQGKLILAHINHYDRKTEPQWDIHSGFEMGIILKGKVKRWHGSFIQILTPGQLWLSNTWEPHGFCVLEPPVDVLVIMLWPAGLAMSCYNDQIDFLRPFRLPPSQRPRICTCNQKKEILHLANQIIQAADENHPNQKQYLLTKFLLMKLLDDMSNRLQAGPKARPGTGPERIIPAINLVHDNPNRRISLAEAANVCHMCPALLVRLFRTTMGTSFAEYARRRRLAALAAELGSTNTKLASLARKFGFTDTAHLTRSFKSSFGVLPSYYRKQFSSSED